MCALSPNVTCDPLLPLSLGSGWLLPVLGSLLTSHLERCQDSRYSFSPAAASYLLWFSPPFSDATALFRMPVPAPAST